MKAVLPGRTNGISRSVMELSRKNPRQLAEKVVRLRYSLEEQERAVSVLREALEQQKRATDNSEKKLRAEFEQRVGQQRQEYEATVRRHQNFVDQGGNSKGFSGPKAQNWPQIPPQNIYKL